MANIRGITIEIAGNTSKLTKALDETKASLVSTSKELKSVNSLLKFDPSNVTLLSQKQTLLAKAIDDTRNRLSQLKELQQKFGSQASLTEEQQQKYRLLEREIAQCEGQLKSYEKQQVDVNNTIENVNKGQPFEEVNKDIQDVGKSSIKTGDLIKANLISQAIISGVKALGNAVKNMVSSLNDWSNKAATLNEQEAKVTQVMRNTTNASDKEIKSLINLTAQQEKLGVVSQETQLAGLQELGTYVSQKESLEKLLPVMNDMIAQQYGVGASMESASGIATMMGKVLGNGQVDALSRLGYKFNDAQKKVLKFGTEEEKVAMLTEIITQSVGGMNKALALTDAGKMAIAKSYFEDFQKTVGQTFNDFKNKVVGTFLPQITQMSDAFTGMLKGNVSIKDGMNTIVNSITGGLQTIRDKLPQVLSTGTIILQTLLKGIVEGMPDIADAVVGIIEELIECIIDNIPEILDAVIKTISEVAKALAKQLPTLIPKLVDGLLNMVETILDDIDLFVDAAIQLIMGMADGLVNAIPVLVEKIPVIIDKLIQALVNNLPKLMKMGWELNMKLAEGLIKAIPDLVEQLPQIISSIVTGLVEGLGEIFQVGIDLIKELWEGIKSTFGWLGEKISDFGNWLVMGLKDALGIETDANSPLIKKLGKELGMDYVEGVGWVKKDAEEAGKNLVKGVEQGVKNKNAQQSVINAASNFAASVATTLANSWKIKSPSRVTEEFGKYLDLGVQKGIEENAKSVLTTATSFGNAVINGIDGTINDTSAAMRSLTSGVNASVNPTINPTANSNPLYITIDKFYNNRQTDIQQLAQELEFYRKNSALAKGGA